MIKVGLMKAGDAPKLLEKKLGDGVDMTDVLELATQLENMPLALTQAAAYLRQMGGRCSIRKYTDKLRKSGKSKKSILDEDAGDLRRDREARNSIFLTWQIRNHSTLIRTFGFFTYRLPLAHCRCASADAHLALSSVQHLPKD